MRPFAPAGAVLMFITLLMAGCAATPDKPQGPPPQSSQMVELRFLDGHDNPVAGAKVTVNALKGSPFGPGPYVTDYLGVAKIKWKPLVIDETAGTEIRDVIYTYLTGLSYQAKAKGFFPARGQVSGRDRGRRLMLAKMKTMDRVAPLRTLKRVVLMHGFKEVFGPGLRDRKPDDPLAVRLLELHKQLAPVARYLGAEFAWPAFDQNGGELTLRFNWLGAPWPSLSLAPLKAQVIAGAALPLAAAVGDMLLPAPGVESVRLMVLGERTPRDDPHAAPQAVALVLLGPAKDYKDLSAGFLSGDGFLQKHPSIMEKR